ncbi:MAG TPA: alpha/beta hydrolase-fold protein [Bryobacteraceae bacterium]|nr:alpha/beta hydrolase-fold protein [Bryobacteraceae bacterium]
MKIRFLTAFILCPPALIAQVNPVQELIEAARADSPKLAELLARKDSFGYRIPELAGRDGVAVWGQEFLFAVESPSEATVVIDGEPAVPMKRVAGTNYWYLLKMMRLGTTHQYHYFASGREIGGYQVAGYNPDSYPQPDVPHGTLSERKTLESKIYPGMKSNYWVYVNAGADLVNGAPLMVWQDGETIVGNQDWMRLRLQTVSDNLVAQKKIPPMVHVLIQPGTGGQEARMMRSIEYDTVSDRYGKYLIDEVLADVQKTYRIRQDAYSRAIAGASSGAICALNVAWYYPQQFSRVLSHIGSYSAIQWHPEKNQDGGYIVAFRVRREPKKNIRVWMSDGADDIENNTGSWPMNNIQLANSLKMRGYDFHFRFGVSMHAIAQGALDLPESLTWLWRDYDPAKTGQMYEMEPSEKAKPLFRVSIANRDAW